MKNKLLLVFPALVLTGCSSPHFSNLTETLDCPQNIKYDEEEGAITFDKVENASKYEIMFVDDTNSPIFSVSTKENSFKIDYSIFNRRFQVRALNEDVATGFSSHYYNGEEEKTPYYYYNPSSWSISYEITTANLEGKSLFLYKLNKILAESYDFRNFEVRKVLDMYTYGRFIYFNVLGLNHAKDDVFHAEFRTFELYYSYGADISGIQIVDLLNTNARIDEQKILSEVRVTPKLTADLSYDVNFDEYKFEYQYQFDLETYYAYLEREETRVREDDESIAAYTLAGYETEVINQLCYYEKTSQSASSHEYARVHMLLKLTKDNETKIFKVRFSMYNSSSEHAGTSFDNLDLITYMDEDLYECSPEDVKVLKYFYNI